MAGLVPAIHVFACSGEDVDARHRAGHDDFFMFMRHTQQSSSPSLLPDSGLSTLRAGLVPRRVATGRAVSAPFFCVQ